MPEWPGPWTKLKDIDAYYKIADSNDHDLFWRMGKMNAEGVVAGDLLVYSNGSYAHYSATPPDLGISVSDETQANESLG